MRKNTFAIGSSLLGFLGLLCILFLRCDVSERQAESAPLAYQRGPYASARPTHAAPGGFEYYNSATGAFETVLAADLTAASATVLNDSPTKPFRRLWATTNNNVLSVGPMGVFSLKNGTRWKTVSNTTTTTFNVASASGTCPACAAFSAWERRYVYVYDSATPPAAPVITFDVSATGPDENLFYKTGTKTHLYLGTVRDHAGVLEQFSARNGLYSYNAPIIVASHGANAPTTLTAIDFAGTPPHASGPHSIPAYANSILLKFDWQPAGTADAFILSTDCATVSWEYISGLTVNVRQVAPFQLISNTVPCYRSSASGASVILYVIGFRE